MVLKAVDPDVLVKAGFWGFDPFRACWRLEVQDLGFGVSDFWRSKPKSLRGFPESI